MTKPIPVNTTSNNVKRYVRAHVAHLAAMRHLGEASDALLLARAKLTGAQWAEAQRLIQEASHG